MSIEAQTVEEPTPVQKPVEATSDPVVPAAAVETTNETAETAPVVQEAAKADATEQAAPASEGVLGYKEPGFIHQFRFSKHFFWFNDEASSKDSLTSYLRSEKPEVGHHSAAWAQETGKGVLFFAKRAEDKANPNGLILLHDATGLVKSGFNEFSFKVGSQTHKFEANTQAERDSWLAALEAKIEESKTLKEEITGRDSYKKTLESFASSPAVIVPGTSNPVKSDTPKKSLDANTATATPDTAATAVEANTAAVDEEKKAKDAEKKAKKEEAKKERSQSRKRNSVFGIFGKKEEEKDVKKDDKAEKQAHKEEKKVEKEAHKEEKKVEKEEKKVEAEQKKEEAKAEHDAHKAAEAAEAAAVAAAPAAVVAAVDKKEEKKEEKKAEKAEEKSDKPKRSSVFGSLFKKENGAKVEKTEKETTTASPAKDAEVPPVSETAPKLDEPIENKPIDTAAVTAPVDGAEPTAALAADQKPKESAATPATEASSTPKAEKKGFLAGLIKKSDKKEETKEEKKLEKAGEEASKDPVAAASAEPTTESGETAAKEADAKDERTPREKRRTSLFDSLGTLKRKTDKSPEPATATENGVVAEKPKDTKREKSPMTTKLGGLFRKPSKAAHTSETSKDAETPDVTKSEAEAPKVNGEASAATDAQPNVTAVEPTDSKIVGDVVPEELATNDVITKPEEVKATA